MRSIVVQGKPAASRPGVRIHAGLWVLIAVLLVGAGGAAWYLVRQNSSKAQVSAALKSATATTATVRRGDIALTASGSGTLAAGETVDLSFSTGGTVAEVLVKPGDLVKAGDVLARLSSSAKVDAAVAAAELDLLQARQALTELQRNGDVALAQAYQTWVTAQKTYAAAQLTAQRTAASARCSKAVTTKYAAALDRATQKLASIHAETPGSDAEITARNDYATAQANYTYCAAYTPDEKTAAQAAEAVAKSAVDQAAVKYNTLKTASGIDPTTLALDEAKVTAAETQLANAQADLAGITLTAPIDGKVVYLAAGAGTLVGTTKFITLADVSRPTINVSVDETDMGQLVVGNTAEVTFDALQDRTFTGKVVQVDQQLTTSGQIRVAKGVIALDADAVKTIETLPLGLNATVTLIGQSAKNTLVIPAEALKSLGKGSYAVMLVGSSGQLTQRTVQVGLINSTSAEITGGLKEGDVVSTKAQSQTGSSKQNTRSTNPGELGGPPPDGGFIIAP